MKALVVDAQWCPREGYPLTDEENVRRRAIMGSQVWRHPRFEIKNVPVPEVKDDEVLIRVKSCGICGSDTHVYETNEEGYIIFSGLTKLPCILGHEFAGVVEKIGRQAIHLKENDKVAVESIMWCGMCQPCRSGAPNQCQRVELMGLSENGALAVSKIFPLSGAQTVVGIQFDFYEIDSWDNELFNIFIDDALVMAHPFDFTVYDASPDMANILPPPPILADLGFGQWPDQTYTHNMIIYPTTAAGFKLGFGATLDGENGDNEAWGIDNLVIIDDVQGPGPGQVIPEPSTMMLLGSGVLGAFLRKRRLS